MADLDIKILKCDMSEDMEADIKQARSRRFERTSARSLHLAHCSRAGPSPVTQTTATVAKMNMKLHKDWATAIKAEFDKLHPPLDNKATSGVWHCIVGSDFACSVTHETHYSCYWSCNNVKILLWKSKDSPFD
jgi:hypothetical protein